MTEPVVLPPTTPDDLPLSSAQMRAELLGRATHPRIAIRSGFCQELGGERAAGPLHRFVGGRRLFALQLYLLLMCVARKDPWERAMAATGWALALDKTGGGAESTVSRNWKWLEVNNLVTTKREGRDLRVWRLNETNTLETAEADRAYTRPTKGFFYLPFTYFTEGWHAELNLAETSVLLIALSKSTQAGWFELPTEKASSWYSISADTLQKGLDGLVGAKLLAVHQRRRNDTKARYNSVTVNEYTLLGPFQTWKPEVSS